MEPAQWIPIIMMLVVLFVILRNRKAVIARKIIQDRKGKENTQMIELAKRYIGKECLIYSFDGSHQFQGTIKEVIDGAILVENAGSLEAINLDFVIRIREFPRNKKGKKKSLIMD